MATLTRFIVLLHMRKSARAGVAARSARPSADSATANAGSDTILLMFAKCASRLSAAIFSAPAAESNLAALDVRHGHRRRFTRLPRVAPHPPPYDPVPPPAPDTPHFT